MQSTRKRRNDLSRDSREISPKRTRRATGGRGGTVQPAVGVPRQHDRLPLGYAALQDICNSDSAEDGILDLSNKSKRFEVLLNTSTDIRPDLMKLVIRAIHLCCSPNGVKQHAERMLHVVVNTTYLRLPLSSFIRKMSYDPELSDSNLLADLISRLAEIFLELLQRFGRDIVDFIPLGDLSDTLTELKGKSLLQANADLLEKKVLQVREYKNEVIRRKIEYARKQQDESQLKPPEKFREISVIPKAEDLKIHKEPFLRVNVVDGSYNDQEHYLDVQFRLLREDFILPLREGIRQLRKDCGALGTSDTSHRAQDFHVYRDVTVLYPVCSGKGMVYRIRFDAGHRSVRRVNWEKCKRLKFASLLCLSSDDFYTLLFATIENRHPKELCLGELEVRFEGVQLATLNDLIAKKEKFDMVESTAFFESYRHVLEGLQEIEPGELPFQEQIVKCSQDVGPPDYENKTNGFFDMSGIIEKEPDDTALPPLSNSQEEGDGDNDSISSGNSFVPGYSNWLESEWESESDDSNWLPIVDELMPEDDSVISDHSDLASASSGSCEVDSDGASSDGDSTNDLPAGAVYIYDLQLPRESLGFNESQMRAFKMALTKRFAVIQGPPGTGKTYVGLKIARVLLQSASLWQNGEENSPILMVSYTNHALDEFLAGLPMEGIVRVGERFSEKLKCCSLKVRREEAIDKNQTPRRIATAKWNVRDELRKLKEDGSLDRCINVLKLSRRGILSFHILKQFMLKCHVRWFEKEQTNSIDDLLCHWLGVKVVTNRDTRKKHERNVVNNDDFHMQVSARGFSNEEDFEDEDGESANKPVTICTAEDTDNPTGLRRNLQREGVMSKDEEKRSYDLTRLRADQRWRLYRLWVQKAEKYYLNQLQTKQPDYERVLRRKFELTLEEDYHVLKNARVIGMTTTCAARYRRILQRPGIRPKIVLIEEAAEVLEAHIITSLTKNCQHLILIGDHQQLRPKPEVYKLAKKYKLEVSLFERMVNVGIQCERLSVQHRMRPEIAALMKHIYDDLQNHESVENYEDIKGVKKNMFFISHSHLENPCDDSHSHVNKHEATFIVALCRYLLQQGYTANQITLLTTYTGQMFAIRECLRERNNEELNSVRLTTVDNFQGEENDIILLSLVRSNKIEKVGFTSEVNRACVALSRAKKGFYCIGNFDLLSKHSDIWSKILAELEEGSIGNALPLVCQIHGDEITAETAEEFSNKAPDGGCQRPCEVRLDCGHACKQLCHPRDTEHVEYCCGEPCVKKIEGCDHDCPKLCCQKCETDCPELVEKTLPSCGHKQTVQCGKDLGRVQCKEQCDKILPTCSHRCQSRCGKPCTKKCQELVKRTDWPCGHEVTIACSATPADCPVPCPAPLECGHQCPGKCGECRMGRVHTRCKLKCGRVLVCSHLCKVSCTKSCPPCTSQCQNRCVHSACKHLCGEACVRCAHKCAWKCRHYKCDKRCSELCSRPRCDNPCKKKLRCGTKLHPHTCRGLCGEICICAVCEKNDGRDAITEIFLGGEDEEDALFIQLPDCKHIFAVSDLDKYMDTPMGDTDDRLVIQLKSCPRCKTAIRRSLRYGNIIKQQLHDIEMVKRKVRGESNEMSETKQKLEARLTGLKGKFDGEDEMEEWKTLERKLRRMDKGSRIMAAVTENQVTLMERHCVLNQKLKTDLLSAPHSKESAESRLEGDFLQGELEYLKKRFLSDRVIQTELQDINLEFTRVHLQLELCLLKFNVTSLNLALDESSSHVMRDVRDELSSGKLIKTERLDKLLEMLAAIRQAYPCLSPLTVDERKQIVSAMDLSQGHWFKCPKGHIYAIGECGGAMESGTCPDCGAVIGGANHQLEEGNELAPEMDGASHAAWSEQANLQNYVIVDEA